MIALVVVTTLVALLGSVLFLEGHNQSFFSGNETVRSIFEALTNLGSDMLYLVLLGIIFLSYDKRLGRRLCFVFFFMVYLTDFLKEFFQDPRPPANAEREDPYTSYGFPSGHTTTSVTFYGLILLSHLDERRARLPLLILCGVVMVVVPVSRLVIGVHDVQDVAGGAVIGLSVLTLYMVLFPRIAPVVTKWSTGVQVGAGVAIALLLWIAGGVVLSARHSGDLAGAMTETAMGAGLLLGCAIAFPLEEAYIGYRPDRMTRNHRMMATVIGLPVTVVAYALVSVVSDGLLPGYVADIVTHSVLILVLALLVPRLLARLLDARPQEG